MRISERLSRENSRDYALRTIKDNIITLKLEPGSQISENELASELGLSRTPVREALLELSKVKLIEIYPQKKSVVALIDEKLVEEARFMRNLMEGAVAELVCQMAVPEDLERLKENVRLQKFYQDTYYPEHLQALDDQFHRILFEIARKEQIFDLMQNLCIHFDRVRSMALASVKNQRIVEDHEELIQVIQQGRTEEVRKRMEDHLNRYRIDTGALRESYPQYFKL